MLLFQRARLLANAEGKVAALSKVMDNQEPAPFHLFFCGDGAVEVDGDDTGIERQADIVSKALYDRGWRVAHFTSRQNARVRQSELERFRIGETQGLVAIRCLDEGIDIPDCRVAHILASGRNPRQFIQRRGRLLRTAPGKEYAEIHDYVVMLPELEPAVPTLERNLVRAELQRVAEFARLAKNRGEIYTMLRPVLQRYDLEHYLV
jgi:superfamily II DNA or RNA helicase